MISQPELTQYPNRPGFKTGGTSEAAALAAQARAQTLRGACLNLLLLEDMTADECAEAMSESVLSVRPRFSELRQLGRICKTSVRRKNASGCSAAVWTVKRSES